MRARVLVITPVVALLLAALIPAAALAQSGVQEETGQAVLDGGEHAGEQYIREREREARLRRAREAHEAQRTESAHRRGAELARQMEANRLRSDMLRDERRESFLQHESWQLQQALRAPVAERGDHGAVARRGELDRQLSDQRQELHQTMTSRDDALRRLQQIRPR